VVGDAVALASGARPVERDRALTVEVLSCLIAIEILEHRRQRFAAIQHLGRLRALAVHVDDEVRVLGE
jgi:hypothetical protein